MTTNMLDQYSITFHIYLHFICVGVKVIYLTNEYKLSENKYSIFELLSKKVYFQVASITLVLVL